MEGVTIKKPSDVIPLLKNWKGRRQENFLLVTLDGAHNVIRLHHITKGLLNRTIVHPRECYFQIIKDYSSAVVFIHNHPSGNIYPSGEDDEITERLCMAGKIFGINVLDHIIVTPKGDYFSYRECGKIEDSYTNEDLRSFASVIAAERPI